MNKLTRQLDIFYLISLTFLVLTAGCKRIEVNSMPNDTPVIIDAKNTEWQNSLTYFENKKTGIGVRNDNESLYLCFINNDMTLRRQFLTRGLILWIQPETSKDKIGIKFPMGIPMEQRRTAGRGEMMPDRAERLEMLDLSELEVLGPDKEDIIRIQIMAEEGIEAKAGIENDMFIYELRISLNQQDIFPAALNIAENPGLRMTFEIPSFQRPAGMAENRSDGMSGGVGGGRSGGRGGRGGGGRSGGMGGGRPGGSTGGRPAAATFKLDFDIILRTTIE